MKRKWYAIMLALVLMFSVTACGKTTETQNPEQGTQGTESVDSSEKNETPENTDVLGGIYSGGDIFTEIPFAATTNNGTKELCTVKVPENYLCTAIYNDKDGNEFNFNTAGGAVEVKTAIEKGLLTQEGNMTRIFLGSTDETSTKVEFTFYPATSEDNYELWKENTENCKVIGSGENEAFYSEIEDFENILLFYKLGEDGYMFVDYSSSLKDEIGVEQVAQYIYDLITVIE